MEVRGTAKLGVDCVPIHTRPPRLTATTHTGTISPIPPAPVPLHRIIAACHRSTAPTRPEISSTIDCVLPYERPQPLGSKPTAAPPTPPQSSSAKYPGRRGSTEVCLRTIAPSAAASPQRLARTQQRLVWVAELTGTDGSHSEATTHTLPVRYTPYVRRQAASSREVTGATGSARLITPRQTR
jgi:hypothetical protein